MVPSERRGPMPRKSPYQIVLDGATRKTLEKRARRYTSAYRDVFRARIVLMAAKGMDNDEIALRLDTTRDVVSMWRKRFFEEGLQGLQERPRRGRPAVFPPTGGRCGQGDRLRASRHASGPPVPPVRPRHPRRGAPPGDRRLHLGGHHLALAR